MSFEPIATKSILDKGEVSLLAYCGSDASIAATARVSYAAGTKQVSNDEQLIRYLMRNQHTSPFEHTFLQFHIKAPIFVLRQIMRHRTASWNEISGRYSEIANEAYVPMEEHLTTQNPKNKQTRTADKVDDSHMIRSSMVHDQASLFHNYQGYLKEGLAREVARINLPLSTYSEVVMSIDLHNMLHFLKLRFSAHAQFETREYAEAMYEMLKPLYPFTFSAWEDCQLNAVTLTVPQVETLRAVIENFKNIIFDEFDESKHPQWLKGIAETSANMQHWVSSSERVEIIDWLDSLSPKGKLP